MTVTPIEPGIAAIRTSAGVVVGYEVEGWTRAWRTLRAARKALRRVR